MQVIKNLRFSGTQVPPDYEKRVQRALWVFQHQRVYCPQRQTLVHLREVPGGQLALGALVPSAAQVKLHVSRTRSCTCIATMSYVLKHVLII